LNISENVEPEFENVLGYEPWAHMGLIYEKNQRPKISCYCTFKLCLLSSIIFTK
jgi:hypothetical protein